MVWHIIGMFGMLLIVFCYWAVVNEIWSQKSKEYLWTNLMGAVLLIISLLFNFNLGSMLIEIFWVYISVSGLRKHKEQNQ